MRVVQKWELTRAALDALLSRLDSDPSVAGEKYEHLRRGLAKFFAWHGTPEPDSAVDDTLDRLARRLNAGDTIDDVSTFAHGIARMVRLERHRQAAMAATTAESEFASPAAATPDEREEWRDECLQRCLGELPGHERELIVAYYVGTGRNRIESRANLAVQLGVTGSALRLRAQRLRDRLRTCVGRCLDRKG